MHEYLAEVKEKQAGIAKKIGKMEKILNQQDQVRRNNLKNKKIKKVKKENRKRILFKTNTRLLLTSSLHTLQMCMSPISSPEESPTTSRSSTPLPSSFLERMKASPVFGPSTSSAASLDAPVMMLSPMLTP